jgi:predicted transcriptional regulator
MIHKDVKVTKEGDCAVLEFKDPQHLMSVLSKERNRIIKLVLAGNISLKDLSEKLERHTTAITRDVNLLEEAGMVKTYYSANPGHGRMRIVVAIAPRIKVKTVLSI